jgi:sugar phosphate isomerase/epimerase
MPTRTGDLSIGFRKGWTEWQRDTATVAKWARDNGFEALDLGQPSADEIAAVTAAGLRLGTVDLPGGWTDSDTGKRQEAAARAVRYVQEKAALGAHLFFTIVPGDGARSRKENYQIAVEGLTPIAQAAQSVGAFIVIEGWPGGGPHLANLCCTPESYRAIIQDIGLPSVAINYDPSHLIRLGVDPIRFLREFVPHVRHVHGKDTERFPEAIYELGLYQGSALPQEKRVPGVRSHGFGEHVWRYTIPGHGETRWTEVAQILSDARFNGIVSVELEDGNFNGTEAGEQAGLLHSLNYLRGI